VRVVPEVKKDLIGWRLGRVVTVVARGFTSAEHLRTLQTAGGHYIAGEKASPPPSAYNRGGCMGDGPGARRPSPLPAVHPVPAGRDRRLRAGSIWSTPAVHRKGGRPAREVPVMTASDRAALIAAYAAGPERLRAALAAVPEAAIPLRPGPDRWSAREIALHLCDAELATQFRMKRAVAEPGAPVPAWDEKRWTDALAEREDLGSALDAFTSLRAGMAALLHGLPEDAWVRTSVHESAGAVTLLQWLDRAVRHTENHAAQIDALAGAAGR